MACLDGGGEPELMAPPMTAEWAKAYGNRRRNCLFFSTYFHRRVIHMIVFSRPPGRRRRAGDVWTSSSGADALRRPRKATLRAALRALRTSSRGPCDAPASRRTTLLAEKPARPSDVSPFYESKYSASRAECRPERFPEQDWPRPHGASRPRPTGQRRVSSHHG